VKGTLKDMKPIRQFTVLPSLPPKLQRLQELAYNIWWCWNLDVIDLFRRLDADLWESSRHNPVLMLGTIEQSRLEEAEEDDGFLAHLDRSGGALIDISANRPGFRRHTLRRAKTTRSSPIFPPSTG